MSTITILTFASRGTPFETAGADFTETRMRALVARVFASSDQGGAS